MLYSYHIYYIPTIKVKHFLIQQVCRHTEPDPNAHLVALRYIVPKRFHMTVSYQTIEHLDQGMLTQNTQSIVYAI